VASSLPASTCHSSSSPRTSTCAAGAHRPIRSSGFLNFSHGSSSSTAGVNQT
jgi:hypothetical protein